MYGLIGHRVLDMTSDTVKLARMQHRHEMGLAQLEMLKTSMANPMVQLIGGYTLIEMLANWGYIPYKDKLINYKIAWGLFDVEGPSTKQTLQLGLAAAVLAGQVAPLIPPLLSGAGNLTSIIAKAAPALAAAGV